MDVEFLLTPLGGDQPSGVDLRHDPGFHAIERLLEPAAKSARVSSDGSLNPNAPAVSWAEIATDGSELAKTGRDLRLILTLMRAAFAQDGFDGLINGLDALNQSIETFWDSIHPGLRDRDTAPARVQARRNALKQIENDDNGLLGDLKFSVLFSAPGMGPITGEDLAVFSHTVFDAQKKYTGASQAELDTVAANHEARVNRVRAASRSLAVEDADRATEMVANLKTTADKLNTLCTQFNAKAELADSEALSLPETTGFLAAVRQTLETAIAESADMTKDDAAATPQTAAEPDTKPTPKLNGAAAGASFMPGQLNSRADVERCLDSIIAFYERTEPSSPIPHLARRMRRMVPMDFVELMEEVAPSGMKEFRNVAGVEGTDKK